MSTNTIQIGDRITRTAFNGHVMEYRVSGFYDDGSPRTTQYDAYHSDRCRCDTWDEIGDGYIPNW